MSLKSFHIFFITVSIALAIGFGVWAVIEYAGQGSATYLLWMAVAFGGAIGLAFHEVAVLNKFKRAHIE